MGALWRQSLQWGRLASAWLLWKLLFKILSLDIEYWQLPQVGYRQLPQAQNRSELLLSHKPKKKNITINRVIEMLQKFILQKFTNIHTFCIEKKILIIMFSVNIVFSHHIKFLEFYNQKVTSDKIWAYILYQGWCKGQSMICGLPTPLHLNLYKVVFI